MVALELSALDESVIPAVAFTTHAADDANNSTGSQAEDHRQVQPSLKGVDIRNVRSADSIECANVRRRKAPRQMIRRDRVLEL